MSLVVVVVVVMMMLMRLVGSLCVACGGCCSGHDDVDAIGRVFVCRLWWLL